MPPRADQARELSSHHRFSAVVSLLQDATDLSVEETALLGINALRAGEFALAEPYLQAAHLAGHLEAGVELGNLWRIEGRYQQALRHFEALEPRVQGELRWRLERWRGVSEYFLGRPHVGLARLEGAYRAFRQEGRKAEAGRTLGTLGLLYRNILAPARTEAILQEAWETMVDEKCPVAKFPVLHALLCLRLDSGNVRGAEELVAELQLLAYEAGSPRCSAVLESLLAALCATHGDLAGYERHLMRTQRLAANLGDAVLTTWVATELAEQRLREGNAELAHQVLAECAQHLAQWNARLLFARARVHQWQGALEVAWQDYRHAAELHASQRNLVERAAALLYAAQTLLWLDRAPEALASLKESLAGLPHPDLALLLRGPLRDVPDILRLGRSSPELAGVLDAITLPLDA